MPVRIGEKRMYEEFITMSGWIGKKIKEQYYFFNIKDKVFAVFESEEQYRDLNQKILSDVLIKPVPNFTGKPHFTAMTLTTKCNMNCPYCYVQPVYGIGMMTEKDAVAAVQALAEQTEEELVIFAWGGEPTQNPEALIAMIEKAQEYDNIKILLISNGVMRGDLLERLLSYKNLIFQISYDGNQSETVQKKLKSKENSLDRMLTSMETISKVSKRVSLRVTVTKRNAGELHHCLIPTVQAYTNRVIIEHLHTSSGRSVNLKNEAPSPSDYTDLVFDIVPQAEAMGLHVKVLPLDQIREGGPNDSMTFLNILDDGNITVSNAVIHHTHKDFSELCIGKIENGHIQYDASRNEILTSRYLHHYSEECENCFVKSICRGSLQRYLFITNDELGKWDDSRCIYYKDIIARWFDETVSIIAQNMTERGIRNGFVDLIPPEGKVQYPVFIMDGGFSLAFRQFTAAQNHFGVQGIK